MNGAVPDDHHLPPRPALAEPHPGGPYTGGPPSAALQVTAPRLQSFGPREIGRLVVIGWTLTVGVLLGLVRPRRGGQGGRTARMASRASNGLVDAFVRLGPTFVKLGQMVASSPGLFPAPLANACLRCLDDVPPFAEAIARRMIEEDLGRPAEEVFASFEGRPLSAASIAQVHACVLPDGREAVLKLQRPAISRRMNTDLRIMYVLARLAGRTKIGQHANVVAVVEDLHQVTNQELNFALEAHRQAQFRDNIGAFGDNGTITAPEVYWEWCGPRMICMERMRGIPMDDFEALRARSVDGPLVLRRGVKVWMEAAMVHGPFHGDVHAGNLWVLDDGRGSYLDFGIMGELAPEWQQLLRELMYTAMIDGDYTRIVRAYKRVGVLPEGIGPDEVIAAQVKAAVDPMLDLGIGEVSLGDVFRSNLQLAQQMGSQVPKELILVSKQLLYFERYAKELAPAYVMARDIYLIKNVFPDEVAARAVELALDLPD